MTAGSFGPPATDVRTAARLVEEGALLIDVREPAEWSALHAPGARHIPLGRLPELAPTLPSDRTLLVVCRSGARSLVAAELLQQHNFDVRNVIGGMVAWAAAGLPLEADPAHPARVA